MDLTEPSHSLEIEIAKLQLQFRAVSDRVDRIDQYGSQEVGRMEARIAVIENNIHGLVTDIAEMRGDIKSLLSFRALLMGAAAVVSVVSSVIVNMVSHWFRN